MLSAERAKGLVENRFKDCRVLNFADFNGFFYFTMVGKDIKPDWRPNHRSYGFAVGETFIVPVDKETGKVNDNFGIFDFAKLVDEGFDKAEVTIIEEIKPPKE